MRATQEAAPRAQNTGATATGKALPMTQQAYPERHPNAGSTASPQPTLFDGVPGGEIEPVSPTTERDPAPLRTNANTPQPAKDLEPATAASGARPVPQPDHSPAAVETKNCNICGETKPLERFWADHRRSDGRQTRCASCANRRRADTKRNGPPPRPAMYVIEDRGHGTPCWIWQWGKTSKGYGGINRDGRNQSAHRWVFEQHGGDYGGKPFLDHLCRNRDCVNPAHLEPVTNAENLRRGVRTKLSDADVVAIRRSTESDAALALQFGISPGYVWYLKTGRKRADAA